MPLLTVIKKGKDAFLDVLFPVFCVKCGEEGVWLCDRCQKNIPFLAFVPYASLKSLDQLHIAFAYKDVEKLIVAMKFKEIPSISLLLVRMMQEWIKTWYQSDMIISFVPMHWTRERWRGFNQAFLIASHMADMLQTSSIPLLSKKRYTKAQSALSARQRRNNVSGSYHIQPSVDVSGKRIVLVDDVYTTGETMQACASVLKKQGAKEIIGCAVACGG